MKTSIVSALLLAVIITIITSLQYPVSGPRFGSFVSEARFTGEIEGYRVSVNHYHYTHGESKVISIRAITYTTVPNEIIAITDANGNLERLQMRRNGSSAVSTMIFGANWAGYEVRKWRPGYDEGKPSNPFSEQELSEARILIMMATGVALTSG